MTTFKAMTWNVENLFRPQQDATEEEKQRYRDKLGLLAGVIDDLSPDVVALQEVGGDGALEDLQGALDGTYPHREVSAFPDGRGIRVAFLSRHAVEEREDVVEFPEGPALDINDITATGGAKPVKRMGRGALRVARRSSRFRDGSRQETSSGRAWRRSSKVKGSGSPMTTEEKSGWAGLKR